MHHCCLRHGLRTFFELEAHCLVRQGSPPTPTPLPCRQQLQGPVVVDLPVPECTARAIRWASPRSSSLRETVGLDPILQHAVQALVGVPPLDAVHRAFPHLQGRRYLWGFPSLVYLEQDAGAGTILAGLLPLRISRFSPFRSSVLNSIVYRFPAMAAAPPRNPMLQSA